MRLINFTSPFMESLSSLIHEEQKHLSPDFSKILIVFPSKRSVIYFRKLFLKICKKEAIYPPKITAIENFISELYIEYFNKKKADKLKRIFLLKKSLSLCRCEFSDIFKGSEGKFIENFFEFAGYGNKLLKFFDELIVEGVSFESLKKEVLYTDYEIQIDILAEIFSSYNKLLEESGYTDRPNMLKELVTGFNKKWFYSYEKIYLCGFFTLNKLETEFFKNISESGKSEIILHSNSTELFSDSGNPAFSHHKKIIENIEGDFFSKHNLDYCKKSQSKSPEFIVKELKSNFDQISFIVESIAKNLSKGINPEKIAVILPDEKLSTFIIPAFENFGISYNLTVGHPFRETALFSFINFLYGLLSGYFHYKDVIKFLSHPFITKAVFNEITAEGFCYSLKKYIKKNNLIFIEPGTENFSNAFSNKHHPAEFYSPCAEGISGIMREIKDGFFKSKDISSLIIFIQEIIKKVLSLSSSDQHENHPFLMQGMEKIYNVSGEFSSLSADYGNFTSDEDKKNFLTFFINELSQQHITISGTPFAGVQIMGVLEARNLQFDAVIIPSMNEGLFPAENPKDLFLNSKIRDNCGLPTYKNRESLYGLYFEEITGCSKFVSISYLKEETDSPSLPSRFLESEPLLGKVSIFQEACQAAYHFPYSKGQTTYPLQYIKKTDEIIKKIQKQKLSSSSLKDYIECPIRFYFKYILSLKEEEKIIEEFDASETGKFIHETLKRFVPNIFNGKKDLNKDELFDILSKDFDRVFKKIGTQSYADILMLKTAKNRFRQFIDNELERKEEGYKTSADNLEFTGETKFKIKEKIIVTLTGRIDRIDEKEGKYFLIDYKTGKTPNKNVIKDFENQTSEVQLSVYAFLFSSMRGIPEECIGGLGYYDLKSDFTIKFLIKGNEVTDYLENSRTYIRSIICEMLDKNTPFRVADDITKCEYCSYPSICRINELNAMVK